MENDISLKIPYFFYFFCILINIVSFFLYNNIILLFILTLILITCAYSVIFDRDTRQPFKNLQQERPLFINGLTYFFMESFAFCISLLIFQLFNLWNNSPDSSRYLFSALIQSEAAIISLIITLTLIGVQLIAQKYSTYVTDIFKKNPDLWILLFIYILSIIFGVLSLNSIPDNLKNEIAHQTYFFSSDNLAILTFIEIFLLFWCLFSLIPFLWNMMIILRPENILTRLKFKIINSIPNSEDDKNDELNSDIISVFDILQASIKNGDTNTTNFGFIQIIDLIIRLPRDPTDYRIRKIQMYLEDYSDFSFNIKNNYSQKKLQKLSDDFETCKNFVKGIVNGLI